MMKFRKGWYVLYVRSRFERKVNDTLSDVGLKSYVPMIKREKKWSDRTKIVIEPLIRSYVFVYLNSSTDLHKAKSVYGACFFLMFGKEFAIARNGEIDLLKKLLSIEELTELSIINHSPIVGEIYKIDHGPLTGMECEVIKVDSTKKIRVRLDYLQQDIVVVLPSSYLFVI